MSFERREFDSPVEDFNKFESKTWRKGEPKLSRQEKLAIVGSKMACYPNYNTDTNQRAASDSSFAVGWPSKNSAAAYPKDPKLPMIP